MNILGEALIQAIDAHRSFRGHGDDAMSESQDARNLTDQKLAEVLRPFFDGNEVIVEKLEIKEGRLTLVIQEIKPRTGIIIP